MKKLNIQTVSAILFFFSIFFISACGQKSVTVDKVESLVQSLKETKDSERKYKVTFIELGSVRCIPCQQMQPVMKSI